MKIKVEKKPKPKALDIVPKGNVQDEIKKKQGGGALSDVPLGNVKEEINLAKSQGEDRFPRITEREQTFGEKTKDVLTGEGLRKEAEEKGGTLETGTLPITPGAGAIGVGKEVVKKAPDLFKGIADSSRKGKKLAEIIRRQRMIDDIAIQYHVTQKRAAKIAGIIAKTSKETILEALSSKPVKLAGKIIAGISGIDVLTTWFASDNIISATPFHLKEIRNSVSTGMIDAAEAEDLISEAENTFEMAKGFVNTSTRYNPALWAFRNIFMNGADAKRAEMDLVIEEIRFSSTPEQTAIRESQQEASNIRNEQVVAQQRLKEKAEEYGRAKAPVGSEQEVKGGETNG